MRLKYPFIVSMSLAASAPIYLDSVGLRGQYQYYSVVETATEKISPGCPKAVQDQFRAYRQASQAEKQKSLGLCKPVGSIQSSWDPLEFYIVQYFATMAMFNYPPVTSPLKAACDRVLGEGVSLKHSNQSDSLAGFKRLLQALIPANQTCFDLDAQSPGSVPPGGGFPGSTGSVVCSDWSGCGPAGGGLAWDYQACSEVTQPLGIGANSTMFLPHEWTEQWMTEHCNSRFNATPSFEVGMMRSL